MHRIIKQMKDSKAMKYMNSFVDSRGNGYIARLDKSRDTFQGKSKFIFKYKREGLFTMLFGEWDTIVIRCPTTIGGYELQLPRFMYSHVAHCWFQWFKEEIKNGRIELDT